MKGHPFNGAAAVMEICATLAPLLASLSSAGGPPDSLPSDLADELDDALVGLQSTSRAELITLAATMSSPPTM